MKCKAKHPIKIGKVLVPAGTEGDILNEPTPRMLESFPNLKFTPNGSWHLVI